MSCFNFSLTANMYRSMLFVCLGFLPLSATWSDVFTTEARVVAVGDVHGAHTSLLELLEAAQIIDSEQRWIAGETHLVSIGDLLDRGPDSKDAMDLMIRLQQEAVQAGGRVHVLIGNHELMNLGGDLRDVSEAEFAALGGRAAHRQAFSAEGIYGRWLRTLPVIIKINDTLFAHAGFSSISLQPLDDLNAQFWAAFREVSLQANKLKIDGLVDADQTVLSLPEFAADTPAAFMAWETAAQADALNDLSLPWYRGTASCHALIEAAQVDAVLDYHGVERLVFGHTPTPSREIESRFQGKAIAIDTGMLTSVYRGQPRALQLLSDGQINVQSPEGERSVLHADARRAQRIAALESSPRLVQLGARAAQKAYAAYLLSEHLRVDLIAPTALIDDGVKVLEEPLISERERLERQLYRPNYCETGTDFDLLAAFDALIGQTRRSVDTIAYSRRDWSIRLLENETAFSTSARLPRYARQPMLASGLREHLTELDEAKLEALLGAYLKPREIRAILKRRDKILDWETEN